MAKKNVENLEREVDYGEIVKNAFDSNGWHFNVRQIENRTVFALPMSAKNCPGLNVKFDVSTVGDSKIRCYLAEDTPPSIHSDLLKVINSLNNRYRYLTLSLDNDGDILAAYDFTIFGDDEKVISKQVSTMIVLLSDIMDKCIPPIMKVIWSAEDEEDE